MIVEETAVNTVLLEYFLQTVNLLAEKNYNNPKNNPNQLATQFRN